MRPLLLVLFLLLGCETPCALVCENDSQCVGQGVLPGYYCLNQTVCLQDCYKCNGQCVEAFDNCGACGHACSAGQFCSKGSCVTTCGFGESNCNGSCYDLATDRNHCGDCGHACARDQICVDNACTNTICG